MKLLLLLCALCLAPVPGRAGFYSPQDQLVILDAASARKTLLNSSSAWLAEYYAPWCGHCQAFSPTWKELALDIQDWRPAVYMAVLDCDKYTKACSEFKVTGYPTVKFFKAFSQDIASGIRVKGLDSARTLRQQVIRNLEQHTEAWPPACPPLEPASMVEIQGFFNNNNVDYLAVIFEPSETSYLGREVTLDMLQFENIAVRRVLPSENQLVNQFGVKSFPSCYLVQKAKTFSRIRVSREDRSSYTRYLRSLRGVRRGTFQLMGQSQTPSDQEPIIWREADSSKVYMADLESALHYTVRVEVAKFPVLEGERLTALKNYVTVLAKYFPARPFVRNLLLALDTWLQNGNKTQISYSDFADVLNNRNSTLKGVLMENTTWVWCQGTEPRFRGFPCALWTLFHVLTVQCAHLAENEPQDTGGSDVLSAMRGYVRSFFGCRECAKHFEGMAAKSLGNVKTCDEAIEWLWERHNEVNFRLAGAPSEDPKFPKLQWPMPDLCPLCQREVAGQLFWEVPEVLYYMKTHFAAGNIANNYLAPESELLARQKMKKVEADKDAVGPKNTNEGVDQDTPEFNRGRRDVQEADREGEEEEEEEEEEDDEEEEEEENQLLVTDTPQLDKHIPRPSIIRVSGKSKEEGTAIVDLDSFVDENYKRKALKAASVVVRRKRSASERGIEAQRVEEDLLPDFDYAALHKRLSKRGINTKYLIGVLVEEEDGEGPGPRRRWFRMIELGFSRLDLSLCIVLYFLSSMCLLSMYLYFHMKTRSRKHRASFSSA